MAKKRQSKSRSPFFIDGWQVAMLMHKTSFAPAGTLVMVAAQPLVRTANPRDRHTYYYVKLKGKIVHTKMRWAHDFMFSAKDFRHESLYVLAQVYFGVAKQSPLHVMPPTVSSAGGTETRKRRRRK